MNFIKLGKLKIQLDNTKSIVPKTQKRRYSRVNSIEQLISYKDQQNQQSVQKSPLQKINQDQFTQIDITQQKVRSYSLNNVQQKSQINSNRSKRQEQKTKTTNNIEINYSKQGMQLLQINQKRQNFNKVFNSILQQKFNKLNVHKFVTNTNIPSHNSQQGKLFDKSNKYQQRIQKQYDFESQIPEGPQLSFRQFAKMQGFKLPQFLE